MILKMSKKSNIYHRRGCRYSDRITPELTKVFDPDDSLMNTLTPCKCCCNLANMYKEVKTELRTIFGDLDISVEFDGEILWAHTNWYYWAVVLDSSTQIFHFYQSEIDEKGRRSEFHSVEPQDPCPVRNIETVMKLIANEEKVAMYPEPFRKQALQIEEYAKNNHAQIEYDGTDLYVITDIAAWKIAYGYQFDWYKLLHCPFGENKLSMEEAKTARYHVQSDVPRNQTPYGHLRYIVKHDIAKQIEKVDYKQLPNKTRRQKKYYRQAQNRATRNSIDRVWELFGQLEAKGEITHTPVCTC